VVVDEESDIQMRALLRPGGCVPATPGAAPQPADAGLVANRALLLVHEHQPPEVALVRDVGGSRISVSQWPGVAPSRRAIIFPTSASGESCGVRCEHRVWRTEPASFGAGQEAFWPHRPAAKIGSSLF
jgi:hypothetical protein